MHYTDNHKMDVTAEGVFQRLVVDRLGGSYCFGLNTLLLEVLKGLGFLAYSGGAGFESRFFTVQDMTDCVHMILFVQIPGNKTEETWLVDVGYGVTGLIRPVLLSDSTENVVMGSTSTELHRLRKMSSPEGKDPSTQWWRFEKLHIFPGEDWRSKPSSAWECNYIFSESPFHAADYQHANHLLNTVPQGSPFWGFVIAIRYFTLPDVGEEEFSVDDGSSKVEENHPDYSDIQYGRYTLNGNVVKKTIGARSETRPLLLTERERIAVLKDVFGVVYEDVDGAEKNVCGRDAAIESGLVAGSMALSFF